MTLISELTKQDYLRIERQVQEATRDKDSFESAAMAYMSLLVEDLKESLILSRLFVTIPYGRLPEFQKKFVDELGKKAGITDKIRDDTYCLTLMGSAGEDPAWYDLKKSQGHVSIPLATSDFVDAIPMMSRLLRQLGAGVDWIDRKDTAIVARTLGSLGGIFWVPNASSDTDAQGRKIIAAQDFVKERKVASVFGFGGGFSNSDLFFVTIIFTRQTMEKPWAESFLKHVNRFKTSTSSLVEQGRLFP